MSGNFRVFSQKPIDMIRSIIRNHLATLWLNPIELMHYIRHDLPLPTSKPVFFSDLTFTTKVDPAALDTRLVSWSTKEGAPRINIVGNVWPDLPTNPVLILVTDTSEILFAMATEAAIHPDGTVQIHGAEPGLCLVTPKQGKEQYDRAIIRGTQPMKQLALEKRQPDGTWKTAPFTVEVEGTARVQAE